MKNPPAGWPRLSCCLYYDDPAAAIDWLCRAFGFEVRLKVEGDEGQIVHSELTFGEALVMVGGTHGKDPGREHYQKQHTSPKSLGGANTQSICLHIDDADAHCARSRAAGAQVFREPATDDYGDDYWADRTYGARDLEGHQWWFIQRVRDPKPHAAS